MSFVGQRPGSEPQQRRSRPVSPISNGSSESNLSLLEIPAVQLSEKVEQLSQDEVRLLAKLPRTPKVGGGNSHI